MFSPQYKKFRPKVVMPSIHQAIQMLPKSHQRIMLYVRKNCFYIYTKIY